MAKRSSSCSIVNVILPVQLQSEFVANRVSTYRLIVWSAGKVKNYDCFDDDSESLLMEADNKQMEASN